MSVTVGLMICFWVQYEAFPPRGEVIEKVVCRANPEQAYALYLPADYDPARAWPLILCLDPARRGQIPVARFAAAAERWGYVVMGSLNSHNYDWSSTTHAVNAMWVEASRRFNIDPRRIYHAGFSGGARASCDLAMMAGKAAGVLAFGAAFSRARPVHQLVGFDFVGVIGVRDMNYRELVALDATMDEMNLPHKIIEFDGHHHWPQSEVFTDALAWIDLQACRRGLVADREGRIQALFEWSRKRAETIAGGGSPYDTYLAYAHLQRDFQGLIDAPDMAREHARRAKDKAVRRIVKGRRAAARRERRILDELYEQIDRLRYEALEEESLDQHRQWWQAQIAAYSPAADEALEPARRDMSARVRQTIQNGIWEAAMVALAEKDPARARYVAEIAVAVAPKRIGPWLTLARARAATGLKDQAFDAVSRACDLGLRGSTYLTGDSHFDSLREHPRYQTILQCLEPEPTKP